MLEDVVLGMLPQEGFQVSSGDLALCRRMCDHWGIPCPSVPTLRLWNCQALLLHWGVLATLLWTGGLPIKGAFRNFVPLQRVQLVAPMRLVAVAEPPMLMHKQAFSSKSFVTRCRVERGCSYS